MGKVVTADNLRDMMGPAGVVNPKHGGPTRRPVESATGKRGLDSWSPGNVKTPEDFRKETKGENRI